MPNGPEVGGPSEEDLTMDTGEHYTPPTDVMNEVIKDRFQREQVENAKAQIHELADREWVVIQDPKVFKELRKDFEG